MPMEPCSFDDGNPTALTIYVVATGTQLRLCGECFIPYCIDQIAQATETPPEELWMVISGEVEPEPEPDPAEHDNEPETLDSPTATATPELSNGRSLPESAEAPTDIGDEETASHAEESLTEAPQ